MPAPLPADLVVAADWSVRAEKRWMALAVRGRDGRWRAGGARPVGRAATLVARVARRTRRERAALVGLDLPIGVPAAYAGLAGIEAFVPWALGLGVPPWDRFATPAAASCEISLHRPFYPAGALRAGEARRAELCAALGVPDMDALRRACDRARPGRMAAEALFWTLGGKQVGKAALAGWRDVLLPALRERSASLWPFDGRLETLLQPRAVVLAEVYPAEAYARIGVARVSKRDPRSRSAACAAMERWVAAAGVVPARLLERQLAGGFGPRADGEDPFDAVVALLGVLDVVLGRTPLHEPQDPAVRNVEGWVLGLGAG